MFEKFALLDKDPLSRARYMNSCYLACILLCVSLSKLRMCAKTPYGNKKKELSCLNQHFIVYFLLAYVDTQNDQAF